MNNMDEMFKEIGTGVAQILKNAAGNYAKEASQDAQEFVENSKAQIAEWAQQLSQGKMTKDDFKFLAVGRLKDLAKMRGLTQVGIAAATLDATKAKVASVVITAISTRIG
jgi:hypothetical protein